MMKLKMFLTKIHIILICFVLNQCCDAELICSVNVGPCKCGTLSPGNYQMRYDKYYEFTLNIPMEHDKSVTIKCSSDTDLDGYEPLPELQLENVEEIALEMCPLEENLTICKCNSVPVPEKQDLPNLNIDHNRHRPYLISDAFKDLKNLRHLLLLENNIQLTSDMFENNQKLISLVLFNNNIKQIPSGIFDNLTNLTYLDISDNQITNLNETFFKSLINLEKLNIGLNRLEHLPGNIFENLTNLTELQLWGNQITNLNETLSRSLTYLKILDLGANRLKHLPGNIFENLTNLIELHLWGNQITNLNEILFKTLTNLKILYLSFNELEHLPGNIFENLTNLIELHLWGNQITNLNETIFKSLTNLKILDLSENKLEHLPGNIFENLTNLTELNLRGNQITNLNETLYKTLTNLKILDLYKNKLEHLPGNIFENLTNLTELNLRGNQITNLNETLFRSLTYLKILDLGANKLEHLPGNIFVNLTNLTKLKLWGNQITNLNGTLFRSLSNLKVLDLHFNKLHNLSENTFVNLTCLVSIDLNRNEFIELPKNLFKNNLNLETVTLTDNRHYQLKLPAHFLAHLPKLNKIDLQRSQIINLPEDTFWHSPNIMDISLNGNLLTKLADDTFRDCQNLVYLNLGLNKLRTIPNRLFRNLKKLEVLYLNNNQLTSVTSNIFSGLVSLRQLDLANNQIIVVYFETFLKNTNLEELNLANNQIIYIDTSESQRDGEIINVTNDSETNRRVYLPSLRLLDFSHNNLEGIIKFRKNNSYDVGLKNVTNDFRHNKIEEVNIYFDEYEVQKDAYSSRKEYYLLDGNPIKCTCAVYDLLRYLNDKRQGRIYDGLEEIVPGDLACKEPERYRDRRVVDIDVRQFICEWIANWDWCPDECTCHGRPYDGSLIVNCSHQYFSAPPMKLPNSEKIVLHLNNNNLTKFDFEELALSNSGYGNITELYIHNNNLSEINWLPRNLQVLELHSNNFKQINVTLLQSLRFLQRLTLHDNPWQCNCDSLDFLAFIKGKYKKIVNVIDVRCGNMSIIPMSSNDFCPPPPDVITPLVIFLSLSTAFVTILLLLYKYNEQAIKIWLYTHKCCLWFVTEEELDKDKRYDAFVSYAYPDEDFVVDELIPNLEQGENPFKLCIHNRDWLAGVWIPDQIARSVEESRRTLVVLTPNFLNSIWGRMELRAAHVNSLIDRRARVIIIKKEDIGPIDDLEPELKLYLRTNTYIQWGDRNFWEKLRYALPHPPPLSRRAALMSQEIRQAVNNEFELVRLSAGEDDSD